MAKFKVVHDFWGKKEHRYYFKGQTIDVDDDRAEELLATHPTVGTPLIEAATPKRTVKKKEEVTENAVSDDK
ncbi:hypothetical protein BTJ35_00630 [Lactobacillus delbrueckii subsp. bulgaricus]|uniref:hypothetical protein n=1 Tax=Lactobacillus phage phiJB TaxID=1399941 RepID=UPI0003B04EA9|nr:hypothetical protein [Lactobacillus delbrueckii]YP_008772049.1 hypothetical protein phiJB_00036 [Lactobacillus phage phiJB]AGW43667.1 hypothetical protein phiJB_00036 [Lactobacillus phage phiJB]AYC66189.1 hypothetical protein D4Z81_01895 [Lactobacillus delbrueckii subsp. bulgaricus]MBT9088029.1 hypothetical protein [Lactobacillus delbrueckii subsp. bulgaricus]MBT9089670.1 hypothetical protein [Lactobacillus delbrueckii subsp. bulgaricus]MBT9091305.1 hypothetical protein [Lactobacillus delb